MAWIELFSWSFFEQFALCQPINMRGRPVQYIAHDVLDYMDGNFAIQEDGFDSDIEGFESDNDDELEPQLSSQEPNNEQPVLHVFFFRMFHQS